jgi:hypothetical protein
MISRGYNIPTLRGTSKDLRVFLILTLALLILTDIAFCRTYDGNWSTSICIKNYPAGASINQAYSNFEHLQINTNALSLVNPEGCPANALSTAVIQTHLEESHRSGPPGLWVVRRSDTRYHRPPLASEQQHRRSDRSLLGPGFSNTLPQHHFRGGTRGLAALHPSII